MRYLIIALCFTLWGCTTTYGPNTLTGGYKEKKLSEDSYIVSFFGNGYTPEQQVWNYWIYRCAELTINNGFELFSLNPSDEHAFFSPAPEFERLLTFNMLDSSGENRDQRLVQYYSYSVTTYSSKAVVNMYKLPIADTINVATLLDAKTIIDELQPYVPAKAKISPPDRKNLFIRAAVEAAIKAKVLDDEEAKKLRSFSI